MSHLFLRQTLGWTADEINTVVWSPDGSLLSVGSDDATIRIYEVNQRFALLVTLEAHSRGVRCLSWSPDSRFLAAGSTDCTVTIWERANWAIKHKLHGFADWVRSLSWSPSRSVLAIACADRTIQLWNCDSGERIRLAIGHQDIIRSIAWSPDGRLLATASADRNLKLWKADTLDLKYETQPGKEALLVATWSPDGRYLATGSVDRTIRLHEASTGNVIQSLTGHKDSVLSLAWSPNGKMIVSGSADRTAKIWSMGYLNTRETLEGHRGSVRSVAWSPDGKALATGSTDRTCRVWQAREHGLWNESSLLWKELESRPKWVRCVSWSPDGKICAIGSKDRTVSVWDSRTQRQLWNQEGVTETGSLAFDKPSRLIEKKRERMDEWTRVIAWSPDGCRIAAAADDALRIFDATNGEALVNWAGMDDVFCVAWSPDGKALAVAMHTWITVFNNELTGSFALLGHLDQVVCVAWSPDGSHIISGSLDRSIRVWHMQNQATSESIKAERELEAVDYPMISLSWSGDGRKIVGGTEDHSLFVWEADSGRLIQKLVGHNDAVIHILWATGDQLLVSSGRNGEVILWLCDSWQIINSFSAPLHPRVTLDLSQQPEDISAPMLAAGELAIRSWALDTTAFLDNKLCKSDRIGLGSFPSMRNRSSATPKSTFVEATRQPLPHDALTHEHRKLRVFLSYAREDCSIVRDLYSRLKEEGIQPWLDEIDLKPGDEWGEAIPSAVRQSDFVLVCLSKRSTKKNGYLQKEIRVALDTADEKAEGIRYLIPVKLDDSPVPSRLARWQWVNLFEDKGYERLVEALKDRTKELSVLEWAEK